MQIEATDNGGTLFAGKNKVLVPSSSGYNYYFTWGLPDNSLLLGAVDGLNYFFFIIYFILNVLFIIHFILNVLFILTPPNTHSTYL